MLPAGAGSKGVAPVGLMSQVPLIDRVFVMVTLALLCKPTTVCPLDRRGCVKVQPLLHRLVPGPPLLKGPRLHYPREYQRYPIPFIWLKSQFLTAVTSESFDLALELATQSQWLRIAPHGLSQVPPTPHPHGPPLLTGPTYLFTQLVAFSGCSRQLHALAVFFLSLLSFGV
jgi:hypothetical protein